MSLTGSDSQVLRPLCLAPGLVAHTPSESGRWHGLGEHSKGVAELAAEFAAPFGGADIARLAGYLHDAGKATQAVQDRFRVLGASTGGKRERLGVPHKVEGGRIAASLIGLRNQRLALAMYQIMVGHHTGIPAVDLTTIENLRGALSDPEGLDPLSRLMGSLVDDDLADLASRCAYPADLVEGTDPRDRTAMDLFARLCHSAVVDADFLDTDAHFHDRGSPRRSPVIGMVQLRDTFMKSYAAKYHDEPDTAVNRVRGDVFAAAVQASESALGPGIYRLPAATGTGKTMAAAGFALNHAARFGKRRVIIAVPFTTITTQNAAAYRQMFSGLDGAVLEHHSSIIDERIADDSWRRFSAPQWDGEFIVTTTVQLFESLFSNRPSHTRKLHRIVDSVIVLDEIQALPLPLLAPILGMLRDLVEHFGVTVLLASATQPAFWELPVWDGLAAHDILPVASIPEATQRVTYEVRSGRPSWESISDEIATQPQALAVVNTRGEAAELFKLVGDRVADPATVYLLSRSMTADHRDRVLSDVFTRLEAKDPVILVSTQLIEAGVDLDFPVVFRVVAPADSVIQAAGRCNRNGRLGIRGGRVVVFDPEGGKLPSGTYESLTGITRSTYLARPETYSFDDPAALAAYYGEAYATVTQIREADANFRTWRGKSDFPTVAKEFRMIPEDSSVDVVVQTHPDSKVDARLLAVLDELRHNPYLAVDSQTRRLLQRHTASASRADVSLTEELPQGIRVWLGAYDARQGLLSKEGLTW